jgi:hypothetical protein
MTNGLNLEDRTQFADVFIVEEVWLRLRLIVWLIITQVFQVQKKSLDYFLFIGDTDDDGW